MSPNISVIIPAYNRFLDLTRSVQSILAQTVPVTEVIVVDDGSTDETPELFPRYISANPLWRERVRYFWQENQGQSVALNNGIARARGEWLGFNAHDDLWLPRKLEWQFRALERGNPHSSLCFTNAWFMNNARMNMTLFQFAGAPYNKEVGTVDDVIACIDDRHAWVQTAIARNTLVRQVGGFDPTLRYDEDTDFIFRMSLVTTLSYVNVPLVLIDRSPASERHAGPGLEWHKEEFRLRTLQRRFEKNLHQIEGIRPDFEKSLRRRLRQIHSAWANLYLRRGDYYKARESVSWAARYNLTPAIALKWALTRAVPRLARILALTVEHLRARKMAPDPLVSRGETGGRSQASRQSP